MLKLFVRCGKVGYLLGQRAMKPRHVVSVLKEHGILVLVGCPNEGGVARHPHLAEPLTRLELTLPLGLRDCVVRTPQNGDDRRREGGVVLHPSVHDLTVDHALRWTQVGLLARGLFGTRCRRGALVFHARVNQELGNLGGDHGEGADADTHRDDAHHPSSGRDREHVAIADGRDRRARPPQCIEERVEPPVLANVLDEREGDG